MKALIQRVSEARVVVTQKEVAAIDKGLLILLGVHAQDGPEDLDWLAKKVAQLRIFPDGDGKMNLSVKEVGGEALVVSQFTLYASSKKGNRPSYNDAAPPEKAENEYQDFVKKLGSLLEKEVKKGVFGADMKVHLINDGPVTLIIDSKNRH